MVKETSGHGSMNGPPVDIPKDKPAKNNSGAEVFQGGTIADAFESQAVHREQDIFSHVRQPRRVHWSIAWSDLMMTMFILFAVMFIYQAANRDLRYRGETEKAPELSSPGKATQAIGEHRLPDVKSELKVEMTEDLPQPMETFRPEFLRDMDRVELKKDQAVRIVLPADLLFDPGRADVKSEAVNSLREIAGAIHKTDDVINVVGHTDNVPIHSEQFATNWELSAIRACRIARFLIEEMGISADRFFVSGHAYFQPVTPNDTIENRSRNRRVEIILLKKR